MMDLQRITLIFTSKLNSSPFYEVIVHRYKLPPLRRSGALVFQVMGGAHVQKVVGSNPSSIYWMDILKHIFVVKCVMLV